MAIQVPYPVINMAKTGENIKRLRIERSISVADIQNFLGLTSPQAVYSWQSGATLPTVDHLCALSYLFDVTMNDILVLMHTSDEEQASSSPRGKRNSNLAQRILLFAAA